MTSLPSKQKKDIVVPDLGESITEATIARWLKNKGDAVEIDEALLELETDKVTLEISSPASGALTDVLAKQGDSVEVGAVVGRVTEGKTEVKKEEKKAPQTKPEPAPSKQKKESPQSPEFDESLLSPAVRKLVMENKIDPIQIQSAGKGGRLTKADVLSFMDKEKANIPQNDTPSSNLSTREPSIPQPQDKEERTERVQMSRLRQRIAERLKEAQNTAAILTTFNEADMSAIMALRSSLKESFEKKHGARLGFMSFFVKACIVALKEIPTVNAEIDGSELIYKNYYDIGVAVGTPQGLVVPVVRDADKKSFAEIELDIANLGKKASEGKLAMQDLQGGTFTISNGGVYGSLLSTPILNPPQSGILGMHKIQERPVAVNGQVVVRPMMYLALSYDHRIIDGREAVTFLARVKECLENPDRILLDV